MAEGKLRPFTEGSGTAGYNFWCPGCERTHSYWVPRWTWNGSLERPSFTPSLRVFLPKHKDPDTGEEVPEKTLCHLHLTDGILKFCGDSIHGLAGKDVPLADWPSC